MQKQGPPIEKELNGVAEAATVVSAGFVDFPKYDFSGSNQRLMEPGKESLNGRPQMHSERMQGGDPARKANFF